MADATQPSPAQPEPYRPGPPQDPFLGEESSTARDRDDTGPEADVPDPAAGGAEPTPGADYPTHAYPTHTRPASAPPGGFPAPRPPDTYPTAYPPGGYPVPRPPDAYPTPQPPDTYPTPYPPGGYPATPTPYPPAGSGYPPAGSGYPPTGSGYPPAGSGYPAQGGYSSPTYLPEPVGYPVSGFPASGHPASPSGGGVVITTVGEIQVTATTIRTPAGDLPLRGSQWTVTDQWMRREKIPTWAVVAAVAGFCVLTVFSLLFLLARESVYEGVVQVLVSNGPRQYVARIPVSDQMQVQHIHNQVNYARSLGAI